MNNCFRWWALFFFLLVGMNLWGAQVIQAQGEEFAEPLITDIFYNTYILDVLSDLSMQAGIPIIADNSVSGFITLELDEVPLEMALKMVLMPGGFIYRKFPGFYLVGSADPQNASFVHLAETQVFRLKYIEVSEAKDLLPVFYEPFVKFNEDRNSLTITAPPAIIEKFTEDLQKLDIPRGQVRINVLVTEISKGLFKELGTDKFTWNITREQEINPDWQLDVGFDMGTITLLTDVFGQLYSQIQILKSQHLAEIKADPWLIVADRKTAELFVGKRQVIVLEPAESTSRVERVDVGVSIQVTPKIISKDELEITITPQVSHIKDELREGLLIRRSELSTTVYVQNKQTMILSGITMEEKVDRHSGLPLISRIPLLRWLFSQSVDSEGEREMFIFITAEIL